MRLLKKSMAILMTAVMVATMTPITAEAASKKYVKSVKITNSNLESKTLVLKKNKTYQLNVKVTVSGKASKKVTYKSSNKKVATVTSKGKIKAVKKGTAKITVTSKAKNAKGKKVSASITVKVGTPVTKVKLNKTKLEGVVGDTATLKATLSPSKPTVKKLSYSSNKKSVATVDSKGVVTFVGKGTATITVKATDGTGKKATCKVTVNEKIEEETTEAPVYLSYEGYKLDWADEFTGTELDRNNWNVELHDPGWVNAELQSYVDSKDNIYIKDGKLVLNPVQTKNADGTYSYTSGRVNTQNKKTYTYGMFEVKAKVPEGMGYLPAFWLMANDENVYGQWPKCGEIDIMEVMGQNTKKAMGTIHYGSPHKEQQGSYVLENGSFSDEYHTFTCEWEPGKITWYVDGVKFHEATDWYSATEGGATISYPAPFDQPFYIILNLAVGGSWVGYPDDATFQAQPYMIDYVRVYQKEAGYDDSNVTAPEKEAVVIRDPDANGNYLVNGDFSDAEDLVEAKDWQFKTANEGAGSVDLSAGNATVTTTNDGTVDYSIQLLQNDVPLIAGQTYVLTYDAYASADRKINVASKAPNNSWYAYLNDTVSLTTTKQTFTHEFKMIHTDDAACTVEFNMGNFDSTATVVIDNVSLKLKDGKIDEAAREAINNPPKSVRADGNYIYNGEFQEGNNPKYLGYWTISEGADVSVTPLADNRKLKVVVPEGGKATISQTGIPVAANTKYELSLDAVVPAGGKIDVAFIGNNASVDKTTTGYTTKFATTDTIANKDVTITFNGAGTYYLDNVRIDEDSLIKNGKFDAGLAGYEPYVDTSAKATYNVDSLTEKNAAAFDITSTGDQAWKIQLKQSTVDLEEGQWYRISLDARSTIDRQLMFAIQRNGAVYKNEDGSEDWRAYSGEKIVDLTKDYTHHFIEFQMTEKTDLDSILSISMGAVGGKQIDTKHSIYIDNILLEKIEEPPLVPKDYDVNLLTNPEFANNGEGWDMSVIGTVSTSANTVKYSISDAGKNDYDTQLKQVGLQLEKGESYEVSLKALSTATRPIAVNVMSSSYTWFGGKTPTLEANVEQEIKFYVDMKTDCRDGGLFISMGQFGDTPASDITLSNISVKKVKEKEKDPVTPVEFTFSDVSLIKTLDAEGNEVANSVNLLEGGLSGVTPDENGVMKVTVDDPGEEPYSVQLQKTNVALDANCTYQISFKASASMERLIEVILQHDGSADNNWDVYNVVNKKNPALKIATGDLQLYTLTFKMNATGDEKANFNINLGDPEDMTEYKPGENDDTSETPGEPVDGEQIVNGDFSAGKDPWVDNCGATWVDAVASATYTADGAVFDITNVGTANWHIQLKQGGLNLVTTKEYTVEMVVESEVARSVEWGFFGDLDGGNCAVSETVALEAGTPKTITKTFTPEKDAVAFILSLGKVGDDCPAGKVTVKSVSVKMVEDGGETPETPVTPTNEEMIVNGNFSAGKDPWVDNCGVTWVDAVASAAYTADGAAFDITNVGTANWHIQLKQGGLNLVTTKEYTVEMVVESEVARSVEWGFFGDLDGGNCAVSETVALEAGTPKTITKTFTPEKDAVAFILSLGKVGDDCPAGKVTIKSVSLKEAE